MIETSVEIVDQILQCDRVVVYTLLSESFGKIIPFFISKETTFKLSLPSG